MAAQADQISWKWCRLTMAFGALSLWQAPDELTAQAE